MTPDLLTDRLMFGFASRSSELFQHESRGEEALEHHRPRLWLHVHVYCFPNMWKHRGTLRFWPSPNHSVHFNNKYDFFFLSSFQQTVIKSFNSTEFHGSGYTRWPGWPHLIWHQSGWDVSEPFSEWKQLDVGLCVCYSMAIIYGVFSASNLIAPSVVAVIGPQLSMFFSGLLYRRVLPLNPLQMLSAKAGVSFCSFLCLLLTSLSQLLHCCVHLPVHLEFLHSVCAGWSRSSRYRNAQLAFLLCESLSSVIRHGFFCSAVLWTAQGNVLAINSSDSTIGRNSGIFWSLMQFR